MGKYVSFADRIRNHEKRAAHWERAVSGHGILSSHDNMSNWNPLKEKNHPSLHLLLRNIAHSAMGAHNTASRSYRSVELATRGSTDRSIYTARARRAAEIAAHAERLYEKAKEG